MTMLKRIASCVFAVMLVAVIFPSVVFADTNGSELQITDQPDKFILQLGPQWAGVEFELKTDAGVFPVPVIVDSTGVLKMDLGGSKTYTLSCVASPVSVPDPEQPAYTPDPTSPAPTEPSGGSETETDKTKDGVPTGILVMFFVGLAAAVGGLLAMRYFKQRREAYVYDEDDDYE